MRKKKSPSPSFFKESKFSRRSFLATSVAFPWLVQKIIGAPAPVRKIYVVPNFHPASCGWLTNFSRERVYCANGYFDHLNRVRDDPHYAFVLSEVNNLIAMQNFQPERMAELRQQIQGKRVELVNGFFLESTINLSGGEALVRLGVEGLKWQQEVFGSRPRFAWTIDVCGTHDQMAQISNGLGLAAMVYTRKNPTGSALHWAESPDGSRILAVSPGHYSEFDLVMGTKELLTPQEYETIKKEVEKKIQITPMGAPILILAGHGDYTLAPVRKEYPSDFLKQWKQYNPELEIQFGTFGQYIDAVLPGIKSGQIQIPVLKGGTAYDFDAFWIQCPRIKAWYRRNEQALQAAEILAAAASLQARYEYPAEMLYHAWLQMFLNMDRNTLWGAAGGMVFEHERSWDVRDRFEWVERHTREALNRAGTALLKQGTGLGVFNSVNWKRRDPMMISLADFMGIEALTSQKFSDGAILCQPELPSMGIGGWRKSSILPAVSRPISLPAVIETKQYRVKIDPHTGELMSVCVVSSGQEMLGGPANLLVAEKPQRQPGEPGDFMLPRAERTPVGKSRDQKAVITVEAGPLATIIKVENRFYGGGVCRREMRFYADFPRIDFVTELNDVPDRTVVVAEFPLADTIKEVRRGIPYGFSHGAWDKPDNSLHGWTKGIVPAVRWSHYALTRGGGMAILDRGLPGRELNGKMPILFLYNAISKYYGYPNSWLSGEGRHTLEYALVFHEADWKRSRVPQMAWEYNCPPMIIPDREAALAKSFLQTSENLIVESMRREKDAIEVRLVECLGLPGKAELTLSLPHDGAAITNFLGEDPKSISGGPRYSFPVRPQQIVTLRFHTRTKVGVPKPLLQWDELAPESKRPALHEYSQEKGHPPRGR